MPGSGARRIEKMLPTDTSTSMFEEPSSGSNTSKYPPFGYCAGITYGASISSDTIPARCPPHSLQRRNRSFATTSMFFCVSPWTLAVVALPTAPPSAPWPTTREIALHASATSRISAFNSPLAPGWRRRSSIRYWVSVVRPASMTASLQASTFVSLGSADSATNSAILPMIQSGCASARRARSVYP